jgi:hypothetical protein
VWNHDTFDYDIGTNITSQEVINNVAGWIASRSSGTVQLEHELTDDTVSAGIDISSMISAAGLINAPIAAIEGDAQRYQGTGLTWPVVSSSGFNANYNPIKGTIM